jgi:hypothetical protein
MSAHAALLVYPEIPCTWTPSRVARAVTSAGFCDGTKNPSAFGPTWGSEQPASTDNETAVKTAPVPPLRISCLPEDAADQATGAAASDWVQAPRYSAVVTQPVSVRRLISTHDQGHGGVMWVVVYVLFFAALAWLAWLARHWNTQLRLERERHDAEEHSEHSAA